MRGDSGRDVRSPQDQISMGTSVLPSLFQGKKQGQQTNLARQQVQDELKEVILYGTVVKVQISLVQHLQGAETARVWRTTRKFHGQ